MAEYRGYSGNPGVPSEKGLATDARAYADWITLHYGGGLPILMGESLGTAVAIRLASERPVRGLALDAPFSSIADVVHAGPLFWTPTSLLHSRFDSLARIRHVAAPIAFLHGGADSLVPEELVRRLAAAAPCTRATLYEPGFGHVLMAEDRSSRPRNFVLSFMAGLPADGSCPASGPAGR